MGEYGMKRIVCLVLAAALALCASCALAATINGQPIGNDPQGRWEPGKVNIDPYGECEYLLIRKAGQYTVRGSE